MYVYVVVIYIRNHGKDNAIIFHKEKLPNSFNKKKWYTSYSADGGIFCAKRNFLWDIFSIIEL